MHSETPRMRGDIEAAFREYDSSGFRQFVEELQADVVNFNLDPRIPKTAEAIRGISKEGFGF